MAQPVGDSETTPTAAEDGVLAIVFLLPISAAGGVGSTALRELQRQLSLLKHAFELRRC